MKHLRAVNKKARRIDEDVVALQNPQNAANPAPYPDGMFSLVLAGLGSGFGRRHGRAVPARRARHLRLLRLLLLAGASAGPSQQRRELDQQVRHRDQRLAQLGPDISMKKILSM